MRVDLGTSAYEADTLRTELPCPVNYFVIKKAYLVVAHLSVDPVSVSISPGILVVLISASLFFHVYQGHIYHWNIEKTV